MVVVGVGFSKRQQTRRGSSPHASVNRSIRQRKRLQPHSGMTVVTGERKCVHRLARNGEYMVGTVGRSPFVAGVEECVPGCKKLADAIVGRHCGTQGGIVGMANVCLGMRTSCWIDGLA